MTKRCISPDVFIDDASTDGADALPHCGEKESPRLLDCSRVALSRKRPCTEATTDSWDESRHIRKCHNLVSPEQNEHERREIESSRLSTAINFAARVEKEELLRRALERNDVSGVLAPESIENQDLRPLQKPDEYSFFMRLSTFNVASNQAAPFWQGFVPATVKPVDATVMGGVPKAPVTFELPDGLRVEMLNQWQSLQAAFDALSPKNVESPGPSSQKRYKMAPLVTPVLCGRDNPAVYRQRRLMRTAFDNVICTLVALPQSSNGRNNPSLVMATTEFINCVSNRDSEGETFTALMRPIRNRLSSASVPREHWLESGKVWLKVEIERSSMPKAELRSFGVLLLD